MSLPLLTARSFRSRCRIRSSARQVPPASRLPIRVRHSRSARKRFTLGSTCTFSVPFAFTDVGNAGTGLIPTLLDTLPNVSSCTTTISSDVSWIVPLGPLVLDQFNEIEANVAFAPNSGPQRTGDVTFAGQTITFTQDAGDNTVCTYSLNPPSATLSSVAGNYSVLVTPSSQSCSYFVKSYAPWITVAANSGLLGGTATVNYSVTANTGGPQTGDLLIGPIVFPITQNAASTCFFTLNSNSANFPTNASTGSVNVIASLPTCPWTATTNSSPFVNITSGASGTGNGTIQYSVAQNSGGGRNAAITVANSAGASVPLNITQASLTACSATLSPSTFNAPAEGASNGFLINLSLNQCSWNAISNNPSDLSITSANFGTGSSAPISFAVSQNPSTSPRTLTITAGCQTFTVIQGGAGAVSNPTPAITSLSPTGVVAGSGALTLTVNGTGFVSGATVSFGGANKTTTFVSSTQLTAAILTADVATVGTPAVVVTNPTAGRRRVEFGEFQCYVGEQSGSDDQRCLSSGHNGRLCCVHAYGERHKLYFRLLCSFWRHGADHDVRKFHSTYGGNFG